MTISQFCQFLHKEQITPAQFTILSAVRAGKQGFAEIRDHAKWACGSGQTLTGLIKKRLITRVPRKEGGHFYQITNRGSLVMETFDTIPDHES